MTSPTNQLQPEPPTDLPDRMLLTWQVSCVLGDCVHFVGVGLLFDYLLFAGAEIDVMMRIGAIALLLAGVQRFKGWLVLLVIQLSLLAREPSSSIVVPAISSVLLSVAAVSLVIYAYHANTVRLRLGSWFARQVCSITARGRWPGARVAHGRERFWYRDFSTTARAITVLGSVLAAMLLLTGLPISASARREWLQRSIAPEYTFWPGPTVIVLLLALFIVLRELDWRQVTASQAKAYVRSTFTVAHHRDLRMIVLRNLKIRRKAVANRSRSVRTNAS